MRANSRVGMARRARVTHLSLVRCVGSGGSCADVGRMLDTPFDGRVITGTCATTRSSEAHACREGNHCVRRESDLS